MMIRFIFSIAWTTACAFTGFGSFMSLVRARGMTCHHRPNLSLVQPHRLSDPPADSLAHRSSTSSCVLAVDEHGDRLVKLELGSPVKCVKLPALEFKRDSSDLP